MTFYNGTTALGTRSLVSGTASLTLTTLPVGKDAVTATYNGSVDFTGSSSSSPLSQVVSAASTSTGLAGSPNPATIGQTVTLTATVTNTAGTGVTPTGTVTFVDVFNGVTTTLGTRSLVAGAASFTTASLAAGTHHITAYFNLNVDFLASSGDVFQVVM